MGNLRWPVIDTHFHIGVNSIASFTEEYLIDFLDEYKIDIQVLFQVNEGFAHHTPDWNPFIGNDYISKIQGMYPKRVIGLATVNPWLQSPKIHSYPLSMRGKPWIKTKRSPALEEVERAIGELGLNGLKMHPLEHNYAFNNSAVVFPVLEKLTEMQEKTGKKMLVVVHAAGDSVNNTPEAIADTAKHFPKILFIMAHSGFVWGYGTVARVIGPLNNVMFDLATCSQKSIILEAYEQNGAQRFTAGTDAPFATPTVKDAIVEDLTNDKEEQQLILGGNLAKYLGLPKIEG